MSTSTVSRPPRARVTRATSDFATLLNQVRDAGLMERRLGFYLTKLVMTVVALATTGAAMIVLGDGWWQLGVAALAAIVMTQLAFIGHEAAHRQIFRSGKLNDWFGLFVTNLFVGLSYAWWLNKHNRHHANPNTQTLDPDLEDLVVAMTPEHVAKKPGLIRAIQRRQGYLFFPLLTLEGINLHRDAIKTVLGRRAVKRRPLEISLLAARLVIGIALPFAFLPAGLAAAFIGVFLAMFGIYMGASFAPNHKGMPVLEARAEINFLSRQVLTSRNIRPSRFVDWLMGGLNYQIEHHLFPSMARPQLRAAQVIVRRFCAERGLLYTEVGLFRSYGIVIQYLNRVGLGERDPFQCPLVASRRPF